MILPSPVTAASVLPLGVKASALTSPPVCRRCADSGGWMARVQQRNASLPVRPTAISRPSNTNLPGWDSLPSFHTVGGEGERSPDAVVAGEAPGDRRPSRRSPCRRLAVGAEDELQHGARVPAQLWRGIADATSQRVTVPSGFAEAAVLPSRLNNSQFGLPVNPPVAVRVSPVRTATSWMPPSTPTAAVRPSGLSAGAW